LSPARLAALAGDHLPGEGDEAVRGEWQASLLEAEATRNAP
jgi:hypothetical protein